MIGFMNDFLIMGAVLFGLLLLAWLFSLLAIVRLEKEQAKKRRQRLEEWKRSRK